MKSYGPVSPIRIFLLLILATLGASSGLRAQATSYSFVLPSPLGYEFNDVWDFGNGRLIGTGDCGVLFTSLDNGQTWSTQTLTAGDDLYGINMWDAQLGAIVSDDGLYLTDDAWVTWTFDGLVFDDGRDVKWLNDTTLIVSGDWGLLTRSDDGGTTWTDISPLSTSSQEALDFGFRNLQEGIAIFELSSSVFYTTDGGITWQDTSLLQNVRHLRLSPNGTAHLIYGSNEYLQSTDGGASWTTPLSSPNNNGTIYDVVFPTDDLGYVLSPLFPFLSVTTDGGQTWVDRNPGGLLVPGGISPRARASFDAMGNGHIFSYHSIAVTADSGKSFQNPVEEYVMNGAAQIRDVQARTATEFYAATFNQGIIRSTNGGSSWEQITSPPFFSRAVHFLDANTGLASGEVGFGLIRTTDGGLNWNKVNTSPTNVDDIVVDKIQFTDNGQWGLAIADRELIESTDGGQNWSQSVLVADGAQFYDVEFASTNIAFAVSTDLIWRSDNTGLTWTSIDPAPMGASGIYTAVSAPSPDSIYVARDDFGVFYSYDGGNTWNFHNVGGTFSDLHFIGDQTGYLLERDREDGNILATIDGGANWFEVGLGICTSRLSMDFWESDFGLVGAFEGIIGQLDNAGTVSVAEGLVWENEPWFGFEGGNARVELEQRLRQDAQFELIDLHGRVVAAQELRRGTRSGTMVIEAFLRGLYILRLRTADQQWSQKVRAGF